MWRAAVDVLKTLGPDRTVVAYDSDYDNGHVRLHARALVDELKKTYKTGIALWKEQKGLDDALVAGTTVKVKVV